MQLHIDSNVHAAMQDVYAQRKAAYDEKAKELAAVKSRIAQDQAPQKKMQKDIDVLKAKARTACSALQRELMLSLFHIPV